MRRRGTSGAHLRLDRLPQTTGTGTETIRRPETVGSLQGIVCDCACRFFVSLILSFFLSFRALLI